MTLINPPEKCLTVRELARRWRCRASTVRAMIRDGRLAAIELNGRIRVSPEVVRAMETGTLAVRPRRRRRQPKTDPEITAILGEP